MDNIIKRAAMICDQIENVWERDEPKRQLLRLFDVRLKGRHGVVRIAVHLPDKACYLIFTSLQLSNDDLAELFAFMDTIQFELKRLNGV